MQQYSNLIEAINGLRKEGYTEDFNLEQQCISCRDGQFKMFHDEFIIDKYFRFDAGSDAADQSIIYAVSSRKTDLKRESLINAYGIYSNTITNEMLKKSTNRRRGWTDHSLINGRFNQTANASVAANKKWMLPTAVVKFFIFIDANLSQAPFFLPDLPFRLQNADRRLCQKGWSNDQSDLVVRCTSV